MSYQDEHLRGQRAKELLNDGLMAEVFELMERDLFDRFKACEPKDTDTMAEVWRLIKSLEKFKNILRGYIANGEHAAQLIAAETKQSKLRSLVNWR